MRGRILVGFVWSNEAKRRGWMCGLWAGFGAGTAGLRPGDVGLGATTRETLQEGCGFGMVGGGRGRGGIGRRAGLRSLWRDPCGFESLRPHFFARMWLWFGVVDFPCCSPSDFWYFRGVSTEASVAQSGIASRCQRECRGFKSLRSLHSLSCDSQ